MTPPWGVAGRRPPSTGCVTEGGFQRRIMCLAPAGPGSREPSSEDAAVDEHGCPAGVGSLLSSRLSHA